ncbi:MAG: NAD(P)-binding protein [Proteobacteria bacterium]|nr:NAD(P)-binding protein [Pseudomonadota bacterium]
MKIPPRIAMIGAGLGGLSFCRVLKDRGISVKCFDKSNRAGGRTSTRAAGETAQFDHGAQYLTIRNPMLRLHLESWCNDKIVAPWDARFVAIDRPAEFRDVTYEQRYVGIPKMEDLAQYLSKDLDIEFDTEVSEVIVEPTAYRLRSKAGQDLGVFDMILWNCPPAQTAKIVPLNCGWKDQLKNVQMEPCWSVMLALESSWKVPFDGAFINEGDLGWMARDSSKPNRPNDLDCWVLHSTSKWAEKNLDISKDDVIQRLVYEAQRVTLSTMPKPILAKSHRWLYSRPTEALNQKFLWDSEHRLGACGDWCGGPRIEGAFESGMALAAQVLSSIDGKLV